MSKKAQVVNRNENFSSKKDPAKFMTNQRKQTDIFEACEEGDIARVQYFLEDNPHAVHLKHEFGLAQPLHYAALGGNVEIAKLLVSFKAPINTKSQAAETALHYAAQSNHLDMVKYLIEIGMDPHMKKYPYGETALDLAEQKKCKVVADWLKVYIAAHPEKTN